MGGGEHGVRGRLSSARAKFGWWQGVYVVVNGAASLPFPFATMCMRYPATARPWRRGRPKRGGESRRKRERTKDPALPRGWRAHVLGCTLARGRRTRMVTRANASAKHCAASRSRAARRGVRRRERKARPESECASTKAAAPANEFVPAWHEGRHHQRRRGATARSTSARRPVHPQGQGSGRPHLGGHGP
jgi:hypothetical protein